jgi:hypothetical protein
MRATPQLKSFVGSLALLGFGAIAGGPSLAADVPTDHHGHDSQPTVASPGKAAAAAALQNMQTLHEKMTAANTPAERQALMADHMKAMQQGMSAMQHMCCQSSKGAMSSQMMQMRMDMMTMMMQMMMDRQQMMGGGSMGGMMSGAPTTPTTPPAPSK